MYYKTNCYRTSSGTEAITIALKELKSKKVIIPTWTCSSLVRAIEAADCEYTIVDSDYDLQIDVKEALIIAPFHDTIIIPHMCGIRSDVKTFRETTNLNIIEDLSQCHGLPELGKYAHIVVCSTAKSKWLDLKRGGLIFTDEDYDDTLYPIEFSQIENTFPDKLKRRRTIASEIINAGVDLIGNESSYLRGMYFTKNESDRKLYEPLHRIYKKGHCPKAESYSDKLNWISIFA